MNNWPANKIEMRNVSEMVPYANNSRTHSPQQVDQIAASINEWGWTMPVLIDEKGMLIAGHGRIMAAQKLGIEQVPTMTATGWTEAQKKAYVIADNKLALNADWNMELLNLEMQELQELDFDLELTGFDEDEIASITPLEIEAGLTDEDAVPELQDEPVTKTGDVWVLDKHRLMCGDSTSIDALDILMNGAEWDVCVFDPPYEMVGLYSTAMPAAESGKKLIVMWDFKRFAIAPSAAINAGWQSQYEFIWDCVQSWYTPNRPLQRHKAIGVFGDDPTFNTEKSTIKDGKDRGKKRTVTNTRGTSEYTPLDGAKHIATVEAFPNTSQNDTHGHGKPVAWITAIFAGIGGGTYIDLFGGSGATLIACENNGSRCMTMELDPKYCDVIVRRWQDFTGKKAVLESTGRKFEELEGGNDRQNK